jgi:hypothetical protein
MNLMLNAYDIIRTHPTPRRFQIGEILLSQFTCPAQEERFSKISATIGGVADLLGFADCHTAQFRAIGIGEHTRPRV